MAALNVRSLPSSMKTATSSRSWLHAPGISAKDQHQGSALEDRRDRTARLQAQITMAKRHIPQVSYTWNHMGFISLAPELKELVSRLSKEYGLLVPQELGIQDGHSRDITPPADSRSRQGREAGGQTRDADAGIVA